jgi:hypothetical protein
LITGVRDPLCGGGSTNWVSPVGGGLNTLGSSVGVGGGGLAGFVSGAGAVAAGGAHADGEVAGSQAGGVDDAQAPIATAITPAPIDNFIGVRMAHLTLVLRPHTYLYASIMAKPCAHGGYLRNFGCIAPLSLHTTRGHAR